MLPDKIKNNAVSDNGRLRLEDYYRSFCTEEPGGRYGVGHILFACYAAFPLLLSADLVNYLWLNFKSYADRTGPRQIDRVVVSDLLLSPLLRPVARRQFEMIPEIRNYLLQLLRDGRWFKACGIDPAGLPQLSTLAAFLDSYTKDESSAGETNAENFRELNQWAALAYLAPAELSARIGRQLQNALENDDENRQLRLHVLIDRIGGQAALNPSSANRKGITSFNNLRKYSKGNRARLFEESEQQVSALFYQLENAFISNRDAPDRIFLPVTRAAGQRLARRKEGRQRMFTLFTYVSGNDYLRADGLKVSHKFEAALYALSSDYPFFAPEQFQALGSDRFNGFEDAMNRILEAANPEDLILVYYRGSNNDYFDPSPDHFFTPAAFQKKLAPLQAKGCKTIMIIDVPGLVYRKWLKSGLQLHHQESPPVESSRNPPEFSEVLMELIYKMGGQLTYADVINLLPLFTAFRFGSEITKPLLADYSQMKDLQMFTNRRQVPHPDQALIIYDPEAKIWRVVEEDFKMITRNTTTTVQTYDKKEIPGVRGEVYIRDGSLCFGANTEGLNTDQIYRIHPHKPKLTIDLYYTGGSVFSANIFRKLQHIKRRGPMLWSSSPSFDHNKQHDYLLEVHGEDIKDSSISWYYSGRTESKQVPRVHELKWVTPATVAPEVFLSKFSAFEYLRQLQYPDWFPDRLPIRVEFTGGWGNAKENIPAVMNDQLRLVTESLVIVGGALRLKPLTLEVSHERDAPLFLDIYVIGQDLSLTKESRQNRVVRSKRENFEFQNHAALERLVLNDIPCYMKILYSYQPINIDFSQEGLKDGSYIY